jgi:hypothetical protein
MTGIEKETVGILGSVKTPLEVHHCRFHLGAASVQHLYYGKPERA